ncbi:SNF2 domain-containing protein CLASSY 1-like [Populus alba x Populus x berolinensis]|uniref:SNF2 domain-containing protein CLASSY 1-like n=1 Tax=Populus alba x Populus x berolinensis TaxID=444605 RepID=A0AAD6MD52_9ROSI|nr:SNF2 domain-containing protein CLASSY 1-like [Populus alba x Populus x berolinensis]
MKRKHLHQSKHPCNAHPKLSEPLNVQAKMGLSKRQIDVRNSTEATICAFDCKEHPNSKKASEFLWRNIARSLVPAPMEKASKKIGGCVISHTPGAGKTFFKIAFLVSYLKLFPGKRPLVLAPKTTLYTWYKEIIKWEIPVPVHLIHGTGSSRVFRQTPVALRGSCPRPSQDVVHILDCLEKMQKWHAQPSVLVMGYTSF